MLGLLLGLFLLASPTELAILSGTPDETRAWIREAEAPGPTVLVLGGVHGNETAGYRAAEEIRDWPIVRGRLIVLPRANPAAIRVGRREHPGSRAAGGASRDAEAHDLNREFDLARGDPDSEPARTLWSLVEEWRPDWVIDLHEGYDYHRQNPRSVGSTVIVWPSERGLELGVRLVERINREIEEPEERFELLRRPIRGSLARAAAEELGAESMILETTWKGPLSRRIAQHRLLVFEALDAIGLVGKDLEPLLGEHVEARAARGPHDALRIALLDDHGLESTDAIEDAIEAARLPRGLVLRRVSGEILASSRLGLFDVLVVPEIRPSQRTILREPPERGRALRKFLAAGGRVLVLGARAADAMRANETCGKQKDEESSRAAPASRRWIAASTIAELVLSLEPGNAAGSDAAREEVAPERAPRQPEPATSSLREH